MKIIVACLALIAVTACDQSKKSKTKKEQTADIFPVTSFIEGQIHLVDSFQLPTLKYITINNKTDTSLISISEFKQIAQEFLNPDLNAKELKDSYRENNFADQSIKGVVFNYTALDKELEIQRADVVVSANPVMNDKVRSIYIEKQSRVKDTTILKKLYWRTDKNFQIITTKQTENQPEQFSIMKVEWDNAE